MAFRPPAAILGGDRLFFDEHYQHVGDASHWLEPARMLARVGLERGIEFHTDDMVDLGQADVLVLGEVPSSRHELVRLRSRYPDLKLILQILESPVGRAWIFDPANHGDFDAIISYNPALQDDERYFTFRIPAGGLESRPIPPGEPWRERKVACMVAHVPNPRPLWIRRSGAGLLGRGWTLTPATWWNYVTEGGSLYRERLNMARQCEQTLGNGFDIFGPGWPRATSDGQAGFRSARGPFPGSKLTLLQGYRFTIAYENCLNDCGYITEKMFDALLAGSIPVYLGDQRVHASVPPDAFVDARQFPSRRHLVEFLAAMTESQWHRMRVAAAAFLEGDAIPRFGSRQYVEAMLRAVRHVTGGHTG